jgi:hypothetical protein
VAAIAAGGLTAGVLDFAAAIVVYHASALRIGQSIAAGLLGREAARAGGWPTALLGVLCHFLIATTAAAVYVASSRRLPALLRRPVPFGLAYGIVVFYFMQLVVLPLSRVGRAPFSLRGQLTGLAIHMVLIGLPIALCERASARRR